MMIIIIIIIIIIITRRNLRRLAQPKYMDRHNAALKVLFFEMLRDLKVADSVPPFTHRWSPNRCTSQKMLKHTGMFLFTQNSISFEPTGWTRDLQTTRR